MRRICVRFGTSAVAIAHGCASVGFSDGALSASEFHSSSCVERSSSVMCFLKRQAFPDLTPVIVRRNV